MVVSDKNQPSVRLEDANGFLEEQRGNDAMFGMAMLRPWIREVHIDGGDRARREVMRGERHPFGKGGYEVQKIVVFNFGPDLSGSIKALFHGEPIALRVLGCLFGDPRSISTAVFNVDLSWRGEQEIMVPSWKLK